jgi:hypothetical protein
MQTKKIAVFALLAATLITAAAYADAEEATTTWGCYGYGPDEDFVPHGWQALTDEQQKAMLEKRLELLESDLDRTEIHEEMQKFRAEQGITGPNFVDEDGDGACDNYDQHVGRQGYHRGNGHGCGGGFGRGMGQGHGQKWNR